MKKFLLTIIFVIVSCLTVKSHPFERGFGYELPFCFQFGTSHAVIQQPFKNTFCGYKAQNEFVMDELTIGFLYCAFTNTKANDGGLTNMAVYGFPVHCWTTYSRVGICVGGIHWIGDCFLTTQSLTLTLFTSSYVCGADDTSNNFIGWTQEMIKERNNFKNERNDFGVKIDYNIGMVGISLINSFYETTFSFHFNIGAKDVTKLCMDIFCE